jgi:hypothetical protein
MVLSAKITLKNPFRFATGALSTFVYTLTGSAVYTFDIQKGYEVIAIHPDFASPTNVDSAFKLVTDVANTNVSVYNGSSVETTLAFSLTAIVLAKKV